MKDTKKWPASHAGPAEEDEAEGPRELDDSELEDVAGGIAWHGTADEPESGTKWEKTNEW